jgi:RNA polymerase sigma-70 factor (ECF subfamily)
MPEESRKDFEQIYGEHSDAIFRHVYLRLHDREVSKDVVQEVFFRFWKYIQKGKVNTPRAFLYQIANNLIIDHWRRKKAASLDALLDDGIEFADEIETKDFEVAEQDVRSMFKNLSPKERDTLVMRYIDDMQVKEIAKLMKESENVVSVRIYRSLAKLRKNGIHGIKNE